MLPHAAPITNQESHKEVRATKQPGGRPGSQWRWPRWSSSPPGSATWKSVGYDFVWDDPFLIGPQELAVHGVGDIAQLWNQPFDLRLKDEAVGRTYFRPLTLFSFALDWATSGDNPRGYHAQNLFWYAVGCVFVWLLAWEISGRPLVATAGAVLFALHPTHP